MKKAIFVICIAAAILLLAACTESGGGRTPGEDSTMAVIRIQTPGNEIPSAGPADSTESSGQSAAPETEEAPGEATGVPATDTPEVIEQPTGGNTPPETTPFVERYMDIEAFRTFYVNPGRDYTFEFGNSDGLSINTHGSMSAAFEGGSLKVNAPDTGYAKIYNRSGETVGFIYSIKPAPKSDARRVKSGFPYYLYFEKGSHTLTVYKADSDGYYTVPFRTICSASGSTPAKTPLGTFTLGSKLRWKVFSSNCHAQFGIEYAPGVYLHGPCYSEQRENSIITYYYDTIGENSTGGCLRMQTGNIYWIYNNCDSGTPLEIVDGSPLGTTSEKPEEIPEASCYDPTDPVLKGRG
ncbi:MAG: L,D-transpeptidase family protein [Clostridia bacterium]|nr:L,D-transpeptidase family protein [Clostridia bacterium]